MKKKAKIAKIVILSLNYRETTFFTGGKKNYNYNFLQIVNRESKYNKKYLKK